MHPFINNYYYFFLSVNNIEGIHCTYRRFMKHESIACIRVGCTAMPSLSVVIPGNENGAWVYLIPGIENPEAGMTLPKNKQTKTIVF